MKFFEFLDSKGGFYYEVSLCTRTTMLYCADVYSTLAMGGRTGTLSRRLAIRSKGSDTLLQGHRL